MVAIENLSLTSPTLNRPAALLIGSTSVEMLHTEGLTHDAMGSCFQALSPEAEMSIPLRRVIKCFPIWGPVGPVFASAFRDFDPGPLGYRRWAVDGGNHELRTVWLSPG
jgi:hypothetical protein